MKNIFLLTILSLFVGLTSCKKEVIEPGTTTNGVVTQKSIFDSWELVDGKFYTEDLDDGDKFYYEHFITNTSSTLDPISGAEFGLDSIEQYVTNWTFGQDEFILNGFYTYDNSGSYTIGSLDPYNVIIGGTMRVITPIEITDTKLVVRVHEAYGSVGTHNYNYFSILTFVKVGYPIVSGPNPLYGYTYGGNIPTVEPSNSLNGTSWVITDYYDGFANFTPNDTLDFGFNTYTINGGTAKNYTLNGIFGNNMSELTLYDNTTLGGDYSGDVPTSFITDGEINSITFNDIFNTNNNKTVWMTKI